MWHGPKEQEKENPNGNKELGLKYLEYYICMILKQEISSGFEMQLIFISHNGSN